MFCRRRDYCNFLHHADLIGSVDRRYGRWREVQQYRVKSGAQRLQLKFDSLRAYRARARKQTAEIYQNLSN